MLTRLAKDLAREGLRAELIEADISTHRTARPYDTVVAHYFLNLFAPEEAADAFAVLCNLVRPGGRLIFADFAGGQGSAVGRWLAAAYYRPANWIAWALGFCALHPIPDYEAMVEAAGGRVLSVIRYPLVRGLANPAYHSILAESARDPRRSEGVGAEPQRLSEAASSSSTTAGSVVGRSSAASSSRTAASSTRSAS
jgi:SAM-dependent methyltransferase